MTIIDVRRWDVWTANVRFEVEPGDSGRSGMNGKRKVKRRPVVILGERDGKIVALKVTTHEPRNMGGEFALYNWSAAGLAYPSTVRSSQVLELEPCHLKERIGRLASDDAKDLDSLIHEMYGTGMPARTYISRNRKKSRAVRRSRRGWLSRR